MSVKLRKISPHVAMDIFTAAMLLLAIVVGVVLSTRTGPSMTLLLNGHVAAMAVDTEEHDGNIVQIRQTTPPVVSIEAGQSLQLAGWAFDETTGAAAGAVLIAVDGVDRIEATYGFRRDDVQRITGVKSPATGFTVSIPAAALPAGRHVLSILVLDPLRQTFCERKDALEVIVAAQKT